MSTKYRLFYRKKKEILLGFESGEISSDGAIVLLEKLERELKLIVRSNHLKRPLASQFF
jgi:hypothetical protein